MIKIQKTSSTSGWGGVVGETVVWSYLPPLSIKGKRCDGADTAGESRSDPFMMKEEMGSLGTHGPAVTRPLKLAAHNTPLMLTN